MFDLFRKLLGKNEAASAVTPSPDDTDSTQDDPGKTHATAPFDGIKIKANGDIKLPVNQNGTPLVLQPPKTHSFFCREPVLNREERIAGYEFILPERVQARLRGDGAVESLQKAYDDALLHNLSSLGASALLGSRRAFVRLSPASLDNPLIAQLPVINTVLIFSPSRQMPDPSIIAPQLDALRQLGFSYGWLLRQTSLEAHPDFLALAAAAEFVQLETGGFDSIQIKSLLKSLQAARPVGLPSLQLLSSGLSSFDEFHLCFHGGFDFFLGSFVNNRENWHPPKSNVNRLHVIELLNSLRGGAEFDLIAQQIKRDPILTFKLLRYLNSPVMGLQSPVTTMDKALMVLGRERFSRWLSLFLFDIKAPGYRDRILTERALARAHFLESLAGQGTLPTHKDQLFILGLFSQLDLLMGQSMLEMLQQAKLPECVHQALLGQPGAYRAALDLAIAAEGLSPEDLEVKAGSCGLNALQVSRSAIEALDWAHEVISLGEG